MPAPAWTDAPCRRPHEHRADGDRGVEVAAEVDVADDAGVRPALDRLELVDDLHRPHLRRAADTVPAGSVARSTSIGPVPVAPASPDTCDVRCITWL